MGVAINYYAVEEVVALSYGGSSLSITYSFLEI